MGRGFVRASGLRSNDYKVVLMADDYTPTPPARAFPYQAFFDLANIVCRGRAQRLPEVHFVWSRKHRHSRRRDTVSVVSHDGSVPFFFTQVPQTVGGVYV